MSGEQTATLEPLAALSPRERRTQVRHACLVQGQCRPITAMETGNTWPAQTVDLSVGGVALRLCRRFEPGTLLALDLCDTGEAGMSMPPARVRYAVRIGPYWLLGCSWAEELEPNELRALLEAQVLEDVPEEATEDAAGEPSPMA